MQLVKLVSQDNKVVWINLNAITSISKGTASNDIYNWIINLGQNQVSTFTNVDYTEAELSAALGITL